MMLPHSIATSLVHVVCALVLLAQTGLVNAQPSLETTIETRQVVWALAYSPDGKTIASGSKDGTIKLWDPATGNNTATLDGHEKGSILSLTFSPDGKILASGSNDMTIKLWDVLRRKHISTLKGHLSWVNSVIFSPDGTSLASASGDKTVKLWDPVSGKANLTLEGCFTSIDAVAFSSDGKTLASGSAAEGGLSMGRGRAVVMLWDVATGKNTVTCYGHSSTITSVAFSPDGKSVFSGSTDRTADGDPVKPSIKSWDVSTGKENWSLTGHNETVLSIAVSADGKSIASSSKDKTIKLWDPLARKNIGTLSGHNDWVFSVVFSPDGKILASAGKDQTLKLWKVGMAENKQPR